MTDPMMPAHSGVPGNSGVPDSTDPGALVLFGGTSDIGLAIIEGLLRRHPAPVVLVARPDAPRLADARPRRADAGARSVRIVDLDVCHSAEHAGAVAQAMHGSGDVGTVVVAFGVLGDPEQAWTDAEIARNVLTINATAAVSIGVLVAAELRSQLSAGGRAGRIVAISTVAAERPRRTNFVYGASKAAMDGFYRGLGQALAPEGIPVLVVRPGFVSSAMTAGHRAALSVKPARVARAALRALDSGDTVVRVPGIFTPLMAIYRNLPESWAARLKF